MFVARAHSNGMFVILNWFLYTRSVIYSKHIIIIIAYKQGVVVVYRGNATASFVNFDIGGMVPFVVKKDTAA